MAKKAVSTEAAASRRTEFRRRVNEKLSRKINPFLGSALDGVDDDKIDYLGRECKWIARDALVVLMRWALDELRTCTLED